MELQIARKQRLLNDLEAACASGDETLRASALLLAEGDDRGEAEAMDTSSSAPPVSLQQPEVAPAAALPCDEPRAQLAEMLRALDAVPP